MPVLKGMRLEIVAENDLYGLHLNICCNYLEYYEVLRTVTFKVIYLYHAFLSSLG